MGSPPQGGRVIIWDWYFTCANWKVKWFLHYYKYFCTKSAETTPLFASHVGSPPQGGHVITRNTPPSRLLQPLVQPAVWPWTHHWLSSLCRLITVHCVQLSLLFNHADTSTIWMWSSCTPHGPDPCPCPLGKCTTSVQYMCTIMWVSIGQHVHSCSRLLTPLKHKSFLHPAMSRTLAKLTQSRTSTSWWHYNRSPYTHSPMGFAKSDYQYAQRLLAQDMLLC